MKLKRFLNKLLGGDAAKSPAPGEIYAFRTEPFSSFAAPVTGRYAAFKILGVEEELVAVVALDGVWPAPPTFAEVRSAPMLREHRFSFDGCLALFAVHDQRWQPQDVLDDVALIGRQPLTAAEREQADAVRNRALGVSYATLHAVSYAAEGEWRWAHDRAALIAENEAQREQEAAERARREERYTTRLSKLTLDQLLSETPFENWTPSPPFPPAAFTQVVRAALHDACRELAALGPKPRKPAVRAVLRKTVNWLNRADADAGHVIETEEREDICMALEEIAFAAGQPSLAGEIDEWREW